VAVVDDLMKVAAGELLGRVSQRVGAGLVDEGDAVP
jgi:hypothetical protein